MSRGIEEIKADIASCDSAWIDSALCRSLRCELYETILGDIPLDRLETICAAEKDGRLVTLPCKVGDKIYHICGENYGPYEDEIEMETVDHFVITDGGDVLIKSDPWDGVICSPEQLGKITQNNTFDD